jgi:hypothetical protein
VLQGGHSCSKKRQKGAAEADVGQWKQTLGNKESPTAETLAGLKKTGRRRGRSPTLLERRCNLIVPHPKEAPTEADAPFRLDNEGPATTYLSVTVFPAVIGSPLEEPEKPRSSPPDRVRGFFMRVRNARSNRELNRCRWCGTEAPASAPPG